MVSGETNFASLPSKTSPSNADMFLLEDTEDTKKINYSALADAILNKLTSKTYSGLDTSAKNLVSAINELNSNISGKIQYREISVTISTALGNYYTLESPMNISHFFPSANKIIALGGRKQKTEYLCMTTVENNESLYAFAFSSGEYKVLVIAIY